MFLVTSPIVINVPTRGLLVVETMYAIVQWLANLNIKRNVCKQETSLLMSCFKLPGFSYTHRRVLIFIDNQRDLLDFHPNQTEQYKQTNVSVP